jgi:hypothetical protein
MNIILTWMDNSKTITLKKWVPYSNLNLRQSNQYCLGGKGMDSLQLKRKRKTS